MGASLGKESLHSLVCGGGYHCVMIGLDGSGKTTILYRLKYGQYINTSPTIGFNCEKVREISKIVDILTGKENLSTSQDYKKNSQEYKRKHFSSN